MKNQTVFELAKRFLSSNSAEKGRKRFELLLGELEKRGGEPDSDYMKEAESKILREIFSRNRRRAKIRRFVISSLGYAASLFLIGLIFSVLYVGLKDSPPQPDWIVKTTETGNRAKIILSDGSMIRLNENSRLEFPEFFGPDERVVKLHGEAYFEVKTNPNMPFKVVSSEAEVRVLGTIFNVNTFKTPEVTVAEGRVSVRGSDTTNNVLLSKGQQVVIEENLMIVKEVNPDFFIGWHTRSLQFNSLPAEEVFKVLERAYGVTIKFTDDSNKVNCLITGRYEGERIETIIKGLKNILDFSYETDISTRTITLTIKKCING
ncbi:FecR family protein [Cyclobacterium xiamenense]|uniref:FecR family protein n=1 Tax=Cyclobacterium xiamenense TaxID=1297121 RepID=UPI0035CFE048